PSMVIVTAENQERVASIVEEFGIGINLGWEQELTEGEIRDRLCQLCNDEPKRRQLSSQGQRLVDGRGSDRVAEAIIRQQAWVSVRNRVRRLHG
ncbi:MAG: hypothetical protein ACRD1X_19710, partial [Vicinamibacteria bacterium]